jgi:hypothetical protein
MFSKITQVLIAIPGLMSYLPKGNSLWYFSENENEYYLNKVLSNIHSVKKISGKHNQIAYVDDQTLVVIYGDNSYSVFDPETLVEKINKPGSGLKITLNHIRKNHLQSRFICYDENSPNQKNGLFNIQTESLVCLERDFYPWCFLDGFILGKKNNNSIILNYNNCHESWRYDVTEIARWRQYYSEPERPGEVRKFIGVWQDELLVALTNHTIIALDIHTGELKRKWRDVPEEKCQNIAFKGYRAAAIPYPEGAVLDSEGGKLVGASGIFYWEIDLHTGALLFEEFSAEFGTPLDKVRYSFASGRIPVLSGDYLFLIGERYHSSKNANDSEVIAFNRKTQTIDWRYTFPLEEGVRFGLHLQSPVLEGSRLYVLDTSGTLHIFERTN